MAPTLRHAIRPRITLVTLATILSAGALIACGDSGEDEAEAGQNFEDAQVEFTECMRENGIDMPDPEPGQRGFTFEAGGEIDPSSEEFQAASEECRPIIEDAIPEGERPDPAEMQDRAHELAECLRDHGYDVPEPQIIGSGEEPEGPPASGGGEFSEELEQLQDDPEFQQAEEECSDEAGLPGPGQGPGGPEEGTGEDGQ